MKKQYHTAAISGILDLEDGVHLLTTGYDKKIYVLDYIRGEVVFCCNNYNAAIVGVAMTSDNNSIVVTMLDRTIGVLAINRRDNVHF